MGAKTKTISIRVEWCPSCPSCRAGRDEGSRGSKQITTSPGALSLSLSPQIFPIPLPAPPPEHSHTPSSQSVCCYCTQHMVNTNDFRLTVSVCELWGSVMHTADDKMQLCAAERRLNVSVVPVSKTHICKRASLLLRVVYTDPRYL